MIASFCRVLLTIMYVWYWRLSILLFYLFSAHSPLPEACNRLTAALNTWGGRGGRGPGGTLALRVNHLLLLSFQCFQPSQSHLFISPVNSSLMFVDSWDGRWGDMFPCFLVCTSVFLPHLLRVSEQNTTVPARLSPILLHSMTMRNEREQ